MIEGILALGAAGMTVTGVALNRLVARMVGRLAQDVEREQRLDRPGRPLTSQPYRRTEDDEDGGQDGCPLCGENHYPGGPLAQAG